MNSQLKDQILIVDDKINNIYALEAILSRPGRELISATSGNDALKVALNQEIDLIILDVQMPGMDGFEVAQILK
jgi:CheY-like chemotaxis protein